MEVSFANSSFEVFELHFYDKLQIFSQNSVKPVVRQQRFQIASIVLVRNVQTRDTFLTLLVLELFDEVE